MPSTKPTYFGYVFDKNDALIILEASLSGTLPHVHRRPPDKERAKLIKSGNVFLYNEEFSGIKRWTDGVPWSPSRVLGDFLVYRELVKPNAPGVRKLSKSKTKMSSSSRASNNNKYSIPDAASIFDQSDWLKSLVGSLIDSYEFKDDGLVKKTITVTRDGVPYTMVSYFSIADIWTKRLISPSQDLKLGQITPRKDLIEEKQFHRPVKEDDSLDGKINQRIDYRNFNYNPSLQCAMAPTSGFCVAPETKPDHYGLQTGAPEKTQHEITHFPFPPQHPGPTQYVTNAPTSGTYDLQTGHPNDMTFRKNVEMGYIEDFEGLKTGLQIERLEDWESEWL